jgi:hypothetical protein
MAGSVAALTAAPVWRHLSLWAAQAARPDELLALFWDGVEGSILWPLLPSLANLSQLNVYELVSVTRGIHSESIKTTTYPQSAMAITGRNSSEWGTLSNLVWQPIPAGLTVFEQLRSGFGSDVYLVGVEGKRAPGDSFWTDANIASLDVLYPPDRTWGFYSVKLVTDNVIKELNASAGRRRFVYGHYKAPDGAGHMYGVNSRQYTNAIIGLDNELGRIRTAFPDLPILVYSDHGFGQGFSEYKHSNSPNTFLATTWSIENRTYVMTDVCQVMRDAMSLPGQDRAR